MKERIRSKADLEKKIDELKNYQSLVDELNSKIEGIKDQIKSYMGDREEVKTNKYVVRYTNVVSSRFDTKGFKDNYPSLYESYQCESFHRRFSIS